MGAEGVKFLLMIVMALLQVPFELAAEKMNGSRRGRRRRR